MRPLEAMMAIFSEDWEEDPDRRSVRIHSEAKPGEWKARVLITSETVEEGMTEQFANRQAYLANKLLEMGHQAVQRKALRDQGSHSGAPQPPARSYPLPLDVPLRFRRRLKRVRREEADSTRPGRQERYNSSPPDMVLCYQDGE